MRSKHCPRAFALLELVIILALMALMLTLLTPAIQAARDAALKNSSRNNMKMLGLALQYHADVKKTFPPLYFVNPKSDVKFNLSPLDATGMYTWQTQILPFIEEDNLYKSISTASKKFTIAADKIKIFKGDGQEVSPSTISIPNLQAPQLGQNLKPGLCNYVALSSTIQPRLTNVETAADGTQTYKNNLIPDGMIIPDKLGKGTSMARMADGTSHTAILCESRELERSNWFTPQESFVCGFLPGDSTAVKDVEGQFYPYFKNGSFVFNPEKRNRTALNYGPTAKDAKQAYNTDEKDPLRRTWGPSGGHTQDITIHGMGDGSVQEVPSDIDPQVYYALITPRGGENVMYPWDNNDRPVGPPGLPETPRFDNKESIPVPPIELPELPVVPR